MAPVIYLVFTCFCSSPILLRWCNATCNYCPKTVCVCYCGLESTLTFRDGSRVYLWIMWIMNNISRFYSCRYWIVTRSSRLSEIHLTGKMLCSFIKSSKCNPSCREIIMHDLHEQTKQLKLTKDEIFVDVNETFTYKCPIVYAVNKSYSLSCNPCMHKNCSQKIDQLPTNLCAWFQKPT